MFSLLRLVKNAVYGAESENSSVTYELSLSPAGKSGYTFGRSQGDLAGKNSLVNSTFDDILENTQSVSGLTDEQVSQIEAAVKTPGSNSTVSSYINQINAALDSSYGQSAINSFDTKQIASDLQGVKNVIAIAGDNSDGQGVFEQGAKGYFLAVAEVAQYVNQFGTYAQLEGYLGGSEAYPDRNKPPITIQGYPTIASLNTFLKSTYYFSQHPGLFDVFVSKAEKTAANEERHSSEPTTATFQYQGMPFSLFDTSLNELNGSATGEITINNFNPNYSGEITTNPSNVIPYISNIGFGINGVNYYGSTGSADVYLDKGNISDWEIETAAGIGTSQYVDSSASYDDANIIENGTLLIGSTSGPGSWTLSSTSEMSNKVEEAYQTDTSNGSFVYSPANEIADSGHLALSAVYDRSHPYHVADSLVRPHA